MDFASTLRCDNDTKVYLESVVLTNTSTIPNIFEFGSNITLRSDTHQDGLQLKVLEPKADGTTNLTFSLNLAVINNDSIALDYEVLEIVEEAEESEMTDKPGSLTDYKEQELPTYPAKRPLEKQLNYKTLTFTATIPVTYQVVCASENDFNFAGLVDIAIKIRYDVSACLEENPQVNEFSVEMARK